MRWSFVRNLLTASTHRGRRPAPRHRLRLEGLEDRCLLSGGITLTPSEPAPQLVGDPITWTAAVANAPPSLVYQFSVGGPRGPFQMVRDFSPVASFTWAPMQEGTYRIMVTIKDRFAAVDTQSAVVTDQVDSRVTGDEAVITPTTNPLVALYSVPPGPKGTVYVEFAVAGVFQQLARSSQNSPQPYVTDLAGNVVWYYDPSQAGLTAGIPAMGADLVPGGTALVTGADSRAPFAFSQDVLREIDLAGDAVRETNLDAINAQLTALGYGVIDSLTHDVAAGRNRRRHQRRHH
jgi:hypothetical protein